MLSGLAGAAGLVLAPKTESAIRHIEFVAARPRPRPGGAGRATAARWRTGSSRCPPACRAGALAQAGNYLNARLNGRTLEETRAQVAEEIAANRTALDALTTQVVEAGLATWAGGGGGALILRGQVAAARKPRPCRASG